MCNPLLEPTPRNLLDSGSARSTLICLRSLASGMGALRMGVRRLAHLGGRTARHGGWSSLRSWLLDLAKPSVVGLRLPTGLTSALHVLGGSPRHGGVLGAHTRASPQWVLVLILPLLSASALCLCSSLSAPLLVCHSPPASCTLL